MYSENCQKDSNIMKSDRKHRREYQRETFLFHFTQAIFKFLIIFGIVLLGFNFSEKVNNAFPSFKSEFLMFFLSIFLIVCGFILCVINKELHFAMVKSIKAELDEDKDIEIIIPEEDNGKN